ncbi:MAG: acetolactate synthase small subunit [Bacteroidetes bacterium]|nr:acetolactate synthase small subunit [Bacteroidota bacterium]
MSTEIKKYTISVFSENYSGILYRITQIFTRRKINIESLTTSESEKEGIHRFTIVVYGTENTVRNVALQIEKLVDVLMASYFLDDEVVAREIALYKMKPGPKVNEIVEAHNAKILYADADFIAIEKTGRKDETKSLFKDLEPHGILEFVRSGRVAVSKPMYSLHNYLQEIGEA